VPHPPFTRLMPNLRAWRSTGQATGKPHLCTPANGTALNSEFRCFRFGIERK
jgi:hypothetical protein